MKVTLKLFASLTDYLPVTSKYTIAQVTEPYSLPPALVHLVLVNGRYIAPAQRASEVLVEGDVLAIWPPIAGG
jgi:molybdopterin synthase sulfur carrier subunit